MITSPFKHDVKQWLWSKLFDGLPGMGKLGMTVGLELKRPIFLVGTGRCGTGLLSSMLKSHPRLVKFPGEPNELWHPKLYPFEEAEIEHPPIEVDPRSFTEVSMESWPPNQPDKIRHTLGGFYSIFSYRKLLFMKSAMVSFMLPKMFEIFPDAKFIHIYRSGPSVVDSYVKKNFGTYSKYDFDENEYRLYCARYWNDCILEIERASKLLSSRRENAFFEFGYEELCSDPERVLNSLARHVGVSEDAFDYDASGIEARNYKVGDFIADRKWDEPLRAMEPAMRLKGYIR